MRAKIAQEKLIEQSSIPYSIVHATQFFEFIKGIADAATDGERRLTNHAARVPGNHRLLVGFHYADGPAASSRGYRRRTLAIAGGIKLDAEELQSGAYALAHFGGMLADPARKYESVDPAERGGVAANDLLDLVAENPERIVGPGIRRSRGEQLSDVGARFRDSQQTTAMIDGLVERDRREAA
jgi:hypothetical protein